MAKPGALGSTGGIAPAVPEVRRTLKRRSPAMRTAMPYLLVAPAVASNAGTPKEEIEHLIAHLGSSGCRFHRNGSWYTAERAVSHLTRKYAHLRERSLVPTAGQPSSTSRIREAPTTHSG